MVRCFCRTNGKVETGIFCVMVVPRVVTLLSSLSCLLCGVCHCECCFLCGVWALRDPRNAQKSCVQKMCSRIHIEKCSPFDSSDVLHVHVQEASARKAFKKQVQETCSRRECRTNCINLLYLLTKHVFKKIG